MTSAGQMHRTLGACVHASGDMVILQVGTSMTALRPSEARLFVKHLARELFRADMVALGQELEEAKR